MIQYWPIFAFISGMWISSLVATFGAAMWISGRITEQDAKRIEMKEALLLEVRQTRHTLYGRIDQQHVILDEKIDDLGAKLNELTNRVTKLETAQIGRGHGR